MSTCDGTRNIRAVPRRNQRHERLTKTVVTSPLRKSWPSKPNPIYTLEGLALWAFGNCFRTREEAAHARDAIEQLLIKGFYPAGTEHRREDEHAQHQAAPRTPPRGSCRPCGPHPRDVCVCVNRSSWLHAPASCVCRQTSKDGSPACAASTWSTATRMAPRRVYSGLPSATSRARASASSAASSSGGSAARTWSTSRCSHAWY